MANEVFGIEYGGPSAAVVHQDRLLLAGGGAVPDVIAASKIGEWLDFDTEGAQATARSGFWFQQVSARGNRFHGIVQQQGLLLFGDVGESSIPPGAFTAEEAVIRENSQIGSDTGRQPVITGNLVVFLQRGGEDARGLVWNEQQLKYLAPSLLTLSGQVFRKARDLFFRPSSGRRGDTVYVIDEDGTMAVGLLRVGAEVVAWSQWQTGVRRDEQGEALWNDRILAGAAPLGRAVFAVERYPSDPSGGARGRVGLEMLAPENEERFDAEVRSGTPTAFAAPAWMQGVEGLEVVFTRGDADEDFDGTVQVHDTGEVVYEGQQVAEIETKTARLGLPYERRVETTQFVKRTQQGTSAQVRPARIIDANIDYAVELALSELGDADRERLSQRLGRVSLEVQDTRRRRRTRGRVRRAVKRRLRQSGDHVVSVRYPCRLGWRERLVVVIESDRHFQIAGVAYRAAA